jgi:hypothetical protein
MNSEPTSLSREDLYQRIWSKPVRDVARDLGLSDVGLAKVCARLNVPRPPRGYWAKLAAGQKLKQKPLPEALPGDELEWNRDGGEPRCMIASGQPITPAIPSTKSPGRLPKTHPLLVEVEALFLKTRSTYGTHLRPSKRALADIFVSKEVLRRALDVANVVYLDLEGRGYRVLLAKDSSLRRPEVHVKEVRNARNDRPDYDTGWWHPSSPTVVYVGAVPFSLTIYEMTEYIEMRYLNGRYVRVGKEPPATTKRRHDPNSWTTMRDEPSGRLCLQVAASYPGIDWKREWKEKVVGDLPNQAGDLASILEKALPTVAELVRERDRRAEEQNRIFAEQQRRWQKEENQRKMTASVKESISELESLAEAWAGRLRIEALFADAEQCALELSEAEQVQVRSRIQRARALLNPKTPLERLLSWKTPEERLPPELAKQLPEITEFLDTEAAQPAESPQSPPDLTTRPRKSYWEARYWWQKR